MPASTVVSSARAAGQQAGASLRPRLGERRRPGQVARAPSAPRARRAGRGSGRAPGRRPRAHRGARVERLSAQRLVLREHGARVDVVLLTAPRACGVFFPAGQAPGRMERGWIVTPKRCWTAAADCGRRRRLGCSARQAAAKSRIASVHLCARRGPAWRGSRPGSPRGFEGRLRGVERLPAHPEGGGHLGDRAALHAVTADHLVLHLHAIAPIEERRAGERRRPARPRGAGAGRRPTGARRPWDPQVVVFLCGMNVILNTSLHPVRQGQSMRQLLPVKGNMIAQIQGRLPGMTTLSAGMKLTVTAWDGIP